MPSPIAHTITAYCIIQSFSSEHRSRNLFIIFYSAIIANAADFDFIFQLLYGKKYHHGFTHSITFTFCVSMTVYLIGYMKKTLFGGKLLLITFLIYSSHLLLDYFTAGGKGIQLFWPFTDKTFISSYSIFPAVQHSKGLFDSSHLIFVSFELGYSIFLLGLLYLWKKKRKNCLGETFL